MSHTLLRPAPTRRAPEIPVLLSHSRGATRAVERR